MKSAVIIGLSFLSGFAFAAMPTASLCAPSSVQVAGSAKQRRIVVFIVSVQGTTAIVRKRDGTQLTVDIAAAQADHTTGVLTLPDPGPVILYGWRGTDTVFHVSSVGHSNPTADRDGPDDDP